MTDQELKDWDYEGPKTMEKRCELIAEFLNRYFVHETVPFWTPEEVYEKFTTKSGDLINIFTHYSAAAKFFYNEFVGPIKQAPALVRQDMVDVQGNFI